MNGSTQVMKPGSVKRWREWARSLAMRSRLLRGRRGPLGAQVALRPRLQLATRERWRIIAPIRYESHLHLAFHPQASLTATARFTAAGNRIPGEMAAPHGKELAYSKELMRGTREPYAVANFAEALRQPASLTIREALLHATGRRSDALIRRLTEQTRRVEERVFTRTPVLARTAPLPAKTDVPAPAAASPDWWKEPASTAGRTRIAASAVNVDQIAETVMRRLDQRVNAWRERTGRV